MKICLGRYIEFDVFDVGLSYIKIFFVYNKIDFVGVVDCVVIFEEFYLVDWDLMCIFVFVGIGFSELGREIFWVFDVVCVYMKMLN